MIRSCTAAYSGPPYCTVAIALWVRRLLTRLTASAPQVRCLLLVRTGLPTYLEFAVRADAVQAVLLVRAQPLVRSPLVGHHVLCSAALLWATFTHCICICIALHLHLRCIASAFALHCICICIALHLHLNLHWFVRITRCGSLEQECVKKWRL